MKREDETYAFPDAVTSRGVRHLQTLIEAVHSGDEAWAFYVIMRGTKRNPMDVAMSFHPAEEIDPAYGVAYEEAKRAGVNVAIIVPEITPQGFGVREIFARTK
jgi:sugar fermentation stimulation protein A